MAARAGMAADRIQKGVSGAAPTRCIILGLLSQVPSEAVGILFRRR
jgi:hypothetical protein